MSVKEVLHNTLTMKFGYDDFKSSLQRKVTEAIYKGTKDVYICMPSGSGKSLCFQLPVVAVSNSFAIVISPTIAHAKNQVDYLKSKNIKAYSWNAYTSKFIEKCIKNEMISKNPKMKLLFVTAEQCNTSHFQFKLMEIQPNVLLYFVIDEAHSVSPWSHDFRRQYRNLHSLRQACPNIPVIAATSTATKMVKEDILKLFNMNNVLEFSVPIFRSNIYYDVWFTDLLLDPLTHLKEFIVQSLGLNHSILPKTKKNCGVIFCQHRGAAISMAKVLTSMGILTQPYLTRSKIQTRYKTQHLWNSGEIKVITATHSFGVGLNKSSVRFVVHWNISKSVGHYYQETGRAGHDSKISFCRIYVNLDELNRYLEPLSKRKHLLIDDEFERIHDQVREQLSTEMSKSLIRLNCRHSVISKHFEDPEPICGNHCDVCKDKEIVRERILGYLNFNQSNLSRTLLKLLENLSRDENVDLEIISGNSMDWVDHNSEKIISHANQSINNFADNEAIATSSVNLYKQNNSTFLKLEVHKTSLLTTNPPENLKRFLWSTDQLTQLKRRSQTNLCKRTSSVFCNTFHAGIVLKKIINTFYMKTIAEEILTSV